MRTKILSCFMLLCFTATFAFSQNIQTLSGKITDSKSNAINNAAVYVLNTNLAAVSDSLGGFVINKISQGKYVLQIRAVGFAIMNKKVTIPASNEISVVLKEESNQLDEVTVTAQKREEFLQQVPVSITAISSKQVQEFRLWNSKEITAIVPNLYAANSGDMRNVTSIRGITTTSYDPAVATYIDGVNQFSLDTYIASLLDIERIEVLRGPQGTLYGRNAMAGVINIITRQPTNTTNGFAEVSVGNYNTQRYSAGLRAPLVKNKFFFGAAAVYDKRNGYYTNEFNNTSFDKLNGFTGNYYLKYLPAAKWAITLNAKHQNINNDGAFPLVNGVEEAFKNPFKLSQDAVSAMIDNTFNASLSANYAGQAFNFSSQTAWQQNHRYYKAPLDGDFSPADAVTVINNYGGEWNKVKVITEELRFTSPAAKATPFNWTAGAYFFHQNNPVKQATHFGKDAGLLGVPDTDFSTINTTKAKNTGYALYGQLTYTITKKLALTGGLRYDYEHKKLTVHGDYQKDGEDIFETLPDITSSLNFSALSPKLGVNFHATANTNLFITYSRGYRTGGLTQLSSDPSQPPLYPYKPEYSNNIEAGIKNTFFNNRLRLNVTAFLTKVSNAQVPTLILPDAITVTKNTGKLTSKGAELELAATPLKGLQLDYNFGYTHAVYKSFKAPQNGAEVNLAGKKQIFTPDVTSLLALQYSYTISNTQQVKLVASGEWFYLGAQYFDVANNIRQPPYNLLNTRVGVSTKHIDIFFWGRNLTNKNYIAYAYDFGAIHLGDPKTYGGTLTVKF